MIFFVSPQLWAWKKHRIRLVQQFVSRMLVIFPFEEAFYRENGVKAEFVGHPLAELPLPAVTREEFARENGLDPTKMWIGLLPGSRSRRDRRAPAGDAGGGAEIARRLRICQAKYEFIVPLAPTLSVAQRAKVLRS